MPISKRTEQLITLFPTDAARDDALTLMHKRERQYRDTVDRSSQIAACCQAIAEALPDASAKERTALLAERRDLQAEAAGLPDDCRVSARLLAGAVTSWSVAMHAAIQSERARIRAKVDSLQPALREAEFSMNQLQPKAPGYDERYQAFREIVVKRQPDMDRLSDIRELSELVTAWVQGTFASSASASREGGVKLMPDGRPIDAHVSAFISDAHGKAA